MTTRAIACASTLGVAFVTVPAVAAPASRVALDVQGCDRADEIERIVGLELGEPLAPSGRERDRMHDQVAVTIRCLGTEVTIRVDSPAREPRKPLERYLQLSSTELEVRPRTIALAAVELIEAQAAPAISTTTTPVVDSPQDTTMASLVVRSAAVPRPAVRVAALASVAAFPGNTGRLLGGGLRAVVDATVVELFVDARAHHGADRASLGDISITTLDGAVGAARSFTWPRLELVVAAGARGGVVRFEGSPDMDARGTTFSAPWLGALIDASVERGLSSWLRASVGIELGVVVLPAGALVGGVREVAIDGAWLAAHGGLLAAW